jgi:hypothetical protein
LRFSEKIKQSTRGASKRMALLQKRSAVDRHIISS